MFEPSVRFFVLRDEDGSPLLNEGEEILHERQGVELSFVDATKAIGVGTVLVTSSRVLWLGTERCFDFSVMRILLHAVTSDPSSYARPCLYCQLDMDDTAEPSISFGDAEVDVAGYKDADDEEDAFIVECSTGEVYLCPTDTAELEPLFQALSKAALLCPDPDDDEDGVAGDWIYNEAEVEQGLEDSAVRVSVLPDQLITSEVGLSDEQRAALAHWDSVFVDPAQGSGLN